MTKQEWQTCVNLALMLEFSQGKVPERKLRLIACACCRNIWQLLPSEARVSVELAEKIANGETGNHDLYRAASAAQHAGTKVSSSYGAYAAEAAMWACSTPIQIINVSKWAAGAVRWWHIEHSPMHKLACERSATPDIQHRLKSGGFLLTESEKQCLQKAFREAEAKETEEALSHVALLRCICNPFRSESILPSLLVWNDNTILKLAQAIYANRTLDAHSILADALEDAGCNREDVLTHLRSDGPHARDCWPVGLILGRF